MSCGKKQNYHWDEVVNNMSEMCAVSSVDGVVSRSMGPFPVSWALVRTGAGGYCLGSERLRWIDPRSQCISDLYKLHTSHWHLSAGLRGEDKGNMTKHAHTLTCLKANAPKANDKNTESKRNRIQHSPQGFYPKETQSQEQNKPLQLWPWAFILAFVRRKKPHTLSDTFEHADTYKCMQRLLRRLIPLHHFQVNRQDCGVWLCDEHWVAGQHSLYVTNVMWGMKESGTRAKEMRDNGLCFYLMGVNLDRHTHSNKSGGVKISKLKEIPQRPNLFENTPSSPAVIPLWNPYSAHHTHTSIPTLSLKPASCSGYISAWTHPLLANHSVNQIIHIHLYLPFFLCFLSEIRAP